MIDPRIRDMVKQYNRVIALMENSNITPDDMLHAMPIMFATIWKDLSEEQLSHAIYLLNEAIREFYQSKIIIGFLSERNKKDIEN